MISRLRGTVIDSTLHTLTLDVQGVGYEIYPTSSCREALAVGEEADVVIYTDVKEDSITLYGFRDRLEKQAFLLLKTVKGVGSKSAADIISRLDKIALFRAIASGDLARLQSVRGVGKKTAERIVVELRDKVGEYVLEQGSFRVEVVRGGSFGDALEALKSLGFPQAVATKALREVEAAGTCAEASAGDLIREALKRV